jgi:hypothetical protein
LISSWRRYRRELVEVQVQADASLDEHKPEQGKIVEAWMYLLRDQSSLGGDEAEVKPLGDWRRYLGE